MTIKITVRDADSGDEVDLELEEDNTVSEVIDTVAGFWNKPAGAYVLRYGTRLMRGDDQISYYGLNDGDSIELIPDPEGGK